MTIVSLENLLKSGASSRLEKIVQTAKDMGALTQALRDDLGQDLAASLVSASVREDELILLCSSSAWAARMRYETEKLLATAKKTGVAASRCQVKVAR
ncbi:MAG: DciA family protein [Woeseia sp.]